MQHLIDVRNQLDRYASPNKVDWHLACITNRWTKRALASAGFGYPAPADDSLVFTRWKPIFSVAEIGGDASAAAAAEDLANKRELRKQRTRDIEQARTDRKLDEIARASGGDDGSSVSGTSSDSKAYRSQDSADNNVGIGLGPGAARVAVVHGLNRPLFHIDLTSALLSAVANVERRGDEEMMGAKDA